jgi:EAL domain-containing protein (putative c-di-GMP-specific phosphodiesterase class I)
VPDTGVPVGDEHIMAALNEGQFEPFFQPKVSLRTGALQGAEALARWQHPTRGLVMPAVFINAMESSGRIDEFTRWILEQSAIACRRWHLAGVAASVSVNVSPLSLSDVTLADRYLEIVRNQGVEPRDVTFEITETAAASDIARLLENLSRLRMFGFGLALDDYGTGYASMEHLTHIPFTELKIDQSFVRGALKERSSRAVLESSLEIADKLRIPAVAEGIESEEQAALLAELGCAFGQGLFIARPMPVVDFVKWTQAHALRPPGPFTSHARRQETRS